MPVEVAENGGQHLLGGLYVVAPRMFAEGAKGLFNFIQRQFHSGPIVRFGEAEKYIAVGDVVFDLALAPAMNWHRKR